MKGREEQGGREVPSLGLDSVCLMVRLALYPGMGGGKRGVGRFFSSSPHRLDTVCFPLRIRLFAMKGPAGSIRSDVWLLWII
jgi:hypothetical protein